MRELEAEDYGGAVEGDMFGLLLLTEFYHFDLPGSGDLHELHDRSGGQLQSFRGRWRSGPFSVP